MPNVFFSENEYTFVWDADKDEKNYKNMASPFKPPQACFWMSCGLKCQTCFTATKKTVTSPLDWSTEC